MGIWKHSSRYWHQPSGWLDLHALTIMVSASHKRRQVIMSKFILGLLLSQKINIIFPEVREERLFGLSAFRRGNKRGYYYTGKRESPLKKKKAIICTKRKKSYLIKCLSSTHANETAQKYTLKVHC